MEIFFFVCSLMNSFLAVSKDSYFNLNRIAQIYLKPIRFICKNSRGFEVRMLVVFLC